MLLPNMTLEEVRREIDKDSPIVLRKAGYMAIKARRAMRPKGDKYIHSMYEYVSKHRNHWICRLEVEKRIMRNYCMAYYYAKRGIAGIGLLCNSEWLMYYTSHFFKRFNERQKLNIVLPNDLLWRFMEQFGDFAIEKDEQISEEVWSVFCVTDKGIMLGIADYKRKFYRMNTYLAPEMLKTTQIETGVRLRMKLMLHELDKVKCDWQAFLDRQ